MIVRGPYAAMASAIFCLLTVVAPCSYAEELSIGVEEFSKDLDILTSKEVAALLVRSATTRALLAPSINVQVISAPTSISPTVEFAPRADQSAAGGSASGGGGVAKTQDGAGLAPFALSLADSVQLDAQSQKWGLRLRAGETFTTGRPIRPEDVLFSLQRCQSLGVFSSDTEFSMLSRPGVRGGQDAWVFLKKASGNQGPISWESIARCPILDQTSSELFGPDLGQGSNLIAAGDFVIESFSAGREWMLQRSRAADAAASKITVRGFRDPRHALTALRTGTIDLLFTSDSEVLAKGGSDQTLLFQECSGYRMLYRKGLEVGCGAVGGEVAIDLKNLKYLS